MPQRAKGPRLYYHERKGKYVIRDTGRPEKSTGTGNREHAEKALALYIAERDRPTGPVGSEGFMISDALDIYGREHAATVAAPARIGYAIDALLTFWGKLPVSAIKGETCRRYAKHRGKAPATVRRELGTLRAALNHCQREGYLISAPLVTLPEKPEAKERWLTRDEAAKLIRAARKTTRGKHLARFILIGLYTGTRKAAILGLRFQPHVMGGWIDTERGLMYRRGEGQRRTKKLQPAARLPPRLLDHLRRWQRNGSIWAVEYQGGRCGDIKTAWKAVCVTAGFDDVTPHTLRHTAITWALQRGARTWDVAGYFGVSVKVIEEVYGHHSPDHQESARMAMNRK